MACSNGAYHMTYQDGFINGTHLFLSSGESDKLDSFKSSAAFANNVRKSTHKSYMSFAITPMPWMVIKLVTKFLLNLLGGMWHYHLLTLPSITYTLVGLTVLALVLFILYYVLKLSHKYGLKRIKNHWALGFSFLCYLTSYWLTSYLWPIHFRFVIII